MQVIDYSKPVKTRAGRDVEILSTTIRHSLYKVAGLVSENGGPQKLATWQLDGSYFASKGSPDSNDLVNVPVKRKIWVNIHADYWEGCYHAREDADKNAKEGRTACVQITWQDGEGL